MHSLETATMGGVQGGPFLGAVEWPASGWFVSVERGICPLSVDCIHLPTTTTVSMWAFTSLMKDALEANSVALATAASASFDRAALQRMESDSGHSQHKCVTSCIRSMHNISY